ncbi:MAG: hypothetical protein IKY66_04785 [Bacteroidales bacterium]|nr:hypothetical protein [Bacteroidales bacterium]
MKKIWAIIIFGLICLSAEAQLPKGYEEKTAKLAENLVKSSKEGNFDKTYKAIRDIQKYEFKLQKDELMTFYSDIHEAVSDACGKHGIDERGKMEMKAVIDALFSDKLKEEVN